MTLQIENLRGFRIGDDISIMENTGNYRKEDYIRAADELFELLPRVKNICLADDAYNAILAEYAVRVWALMFAGDDYPLLELIDAQELISDIQRRWDSIDLQEAVLYMVLKDVEYVLSKNIGELDGKEN